MNQHTSELPKQAVQNTLWAYLSFISGKALIFVSQIILARILAPEQFGVMGYCLVAIQYLDILNSFGVDSAVIARRDRVEESANAAFIIAITSSLLLYGTAWIIAPAIALFFNEPLVTPLFRVLGFSLVLSALGVIPSAMLQRGMRFKAKLLPDVGRSIAKGGISILLATQGYGVWSLVWGQLAGEFIATLFLWSMARWRPTNRFDRQVTRAMLKFGTHIISVGLIGAFIINVDYLLVGRLLGATALGFYTIAYRIPELIIRNTNYVIGRIAFPLLSRAQSSSKDLHIIYFNLLRYVSLLTIPAGFGLALISRPFMTAFFSPIWLPAVPVMQLIAIALVISSVGHLPGIIYKATNRPDVLNQISGYKLVFTVAVLWFSTRWGIVGVAAGQVAVSIFSVILDTLVVSHVIKFTARDMVRSIAPSLGGVTIMVLAITFVDWALEPQRFVALGLFLLVGVVVYGSVLLFTSRDTVTRARTVLRSALTRS